MVETPWPMLFDNNPWVDWVTTAHLTTTKRHIKPKYTVDSVLSPPILRQMLDYVDPQYDGKPQLFLRPEEIDEVTKELASPYIAVAPCGKGGFSANRKDWGVEKFQRLRNVFPDATWVQVGVRSDPLLENVIDTRHYSIRKAACVLQKSLFCVCLEGGIMHLAQSVKKKCLVIYGGHIHPQTTGYDSNINIGSSAVCSPCYHSDYPSKPCRDMRCMSAISVDFVAETIRTHFQDELLQSQPSS